jgi:myo-inositol-1(or 4)-monophosphatase
VRSPSPQKLLATAVRAAQAAGKVLMKHYGKLSASQISQKSRNDFVTEVDKASEKLILSILRKEFPSHAVQAEESGVTSGDGTSNYIHRFPRFSISIGAQKDGRMVAGVIYDPLHKELFTASLGKGAYLNGRRIRVSPVGQLADSLMATGIPFRARNRFGEYIESLREISLASAGMRRGGSAALDLAYVACGRFEGFWEINLSPWDIAAGEMLIREAGGKITDVWGKPAFLANGDVLASNGLIHAPLQKITAGIFTPKPESP